MSGFENLRCHVADCKPWAMQHYDEAVDKGAWRDLLMLADSHDRLVWLLAIYRDLPLTTQEAADLLVDTVSSSDRPMMHCGLSLCFCLMDLLNAGARGYDSEVARRTWEGFEDRISVYRGTVQAEVDQAGYGVCWTTDPAVAEWFATEHGRFRNLSSPPVLLTATIDKSDIVGVATDREESEVLLCGDPLLEVDITVTALAVEAAA